MNNFANLIPCPGCSDTITKNAETCPHCGYATHYLAHQIHKLFFYLCLLALAFLFLHAYLKGYV